jgi:pimeloyl-ACP methyl ester carboxylesterase
LPGTDASSAGRTGSSSRRRLCDALGLARPAVLGSSFGGFVALTYAGLFPGHPGGIILANTTGGRSNHQLSVEVFRRLGGDEAAAVAERDFTELTEESAAEFDRVCYPLYSSKPGYAEESRRRLARSIQTIDVNLHYFRNETQRFDPWSVLAGARHNIFRDRPDLAFPAVEEFMRHVKDGERAG